MRCESILAHVWIINQPAFDHIPPKQPLKPAQHKHRDKVGRYPSSQISLVPKPKKSECKYESDGSTQHPMRPLKIENSLEGLKRHALINFLILRIFAIVIKLLLPLSCTDRWQNARNGLPTNHRQTGIGQPGHTTQ